MPKRPTAVIVIGWFFRVGGILGMVVALPFSLWGKDLFGEYWADTLQQLSPTVLFLWMFISSLLGLLVGNGILKGKNGARILAVAYCVVATLIGALMYEDQPPYWINLIGNVIFTMVLWLFLYLPPVTAFFKREEPLPG